MLIDSIAFWAGAWIPVLHAIQQIQSSFRYGNHLEDHVHQRAHNQDNLLECTTSGRRNSWICLPLLPILIAKQQSN